jgi:hypothetical protein
MREGPKTMRILSTDAVEQPICTARGNTVSLMARDAGCGHPLMAKEASSWCKQPRGASEAECDQRS